MKVRIIINHVTGEYESEDREMTESEAKILIRSLSNGDNIFSMDGRRGNCILQHYQFSVNVLNNSVVSYRIVG
jgi:hypothetical protein